MNQLFTFVVDVRLPADDGASSDGRRGLER